jgi:hypothetical protein
MALAAVPGESKSGKMGKLNSELWITGFQQADAVSPQKDLRLF